MRGIWNFVKAVVGPLWEALGWWGRIVTIASVLGYTAIATAPGRVGEHLPSTPLGWALILTAIFGASTWRLQRRWDRYHDGVPKVVLGRPPACDARLLVPRFESGYHVYLTPSGAAQMLPPSDPNEPVRRSGTMRHFAHAWFKNQPIVASPSSSESKVAAHLTFFSADGRTELLNGSVLGRWTHLDQPEHFDFTASKEALETTTLDANGIERELDLVMKFQNDDSCFARHAYDGSGDINPAREIRESVFLVRVDIRSPRIANASFWFRIQNLGRGSGLSVQAVSSPSERSATG